MSERERVGGGTVEDQKSLAIGFENLPYLCAELFGPAILSIGSCRAMIGFGEGSPGFGTNAGGVIAGELVTLVGHREKSLSDIGKRSNRA